MLLAALWVLGLAVTDGMFRAQNINRATNFSISDVPATSRHPNATGRRTVVLPQSSMDSRWWILHADTLGDGKPARVRTTEQDNAPHGRDVHWSSPLIWILAGLGKLSSASSTEWVSLWVGPLLLLFSLAVCWLGILRFLDPLTSCFLLVALGTNVTIFQAFRVGETDHHGLVAIFGALSVLALSIVGLGSSSRTPNSNTADKAHPRFSEQGKGMVDFSAICGAVGLWLSASSTLPLLAMMGVTSLCLGMLGPLFGVKMPNPLLWKRWGMVGGSLSVGFYLLEYFPSHLGLRSEVNHPLYGFAWAGGGWLLYRLLHQRNGGRFFEGRADVARLCLALAVCAAPLLVILCIPSAFLVRDPFLVELHHRHIVEFQGLIPALLRHGTVVAWLEVFFWPAAVVASMILIRKKIDLVFAVVFPVLVAALFFGMAIVQQRWLVSSMALWIVAAGMILRVIVLSTEKPSWLLKGIVGVTCILSFFLFPLNRVMQESRMIWNGGSFPKEWLQVILLRDVSHRLLDARGGKPATVLSTPSASTELAFYGNHKVIGTLYWENLEGLKRAAEMFTVPEESDAKRLVESAGITHLLLPSWDQFSSTDGSLPQFLSSDGPTKGFLDRVLRGEADPPDWMRPLTYQIPKEFGLAGEYIHLFQVEQGQTRGEALYFRALDYYDRLDYSKAYELAGKIPAGDSFHKRAIELKAAIRYHFLPRSQDSG